DQEQLPFPAEVTLDALCLNAPTLTDLTADQHKIAVEILDTFGADLDSARALVTGAAGAGKSVLLNFFMRYAYENGMEPVLLAPSGIAANHIHGHTIHCYLNISRTEGSGDIPECNPLRLTLRLEAIRARGRVPCILVDEGSMISHQLLQVMSQAFGQATGDERPFENCKRQENDDRFKVFLQLLQKYDDKNLWERNILNQFLWSHCWNPGEDRAEDYIHLFSEADAMRGFNTERLAPLPIALSISEQICIVWVDSAISLAAIIEVAIRWFVKRCDLLDRLWVPKAALAVYHAIRLKT
ncbi:hypothetical protein BGX27_002299, partial [Mortierella sp. AM989]